MVKLVYCVRRRSDVSSEEFHRYWLEDHGPLVKRHAEDLRARRYVQSHTLVTGANDALQQSRGCEEPYDGITEVWWESLEEFVEASSTANGERAAKALLQDESQFIDLARSRLFLTEEHTIFDGSEEVTF